MAKMWYDITKFLRHRKFPGYPFYAHCLMGIFAAYAIVVGRLVVACPYLVIFIHHMCVCVCMLCAA